MDAVESVHVHNGSVDTELVAVVTREGEFGGVVKSNSVQAKPREANVVLNTTLVSAGKRVRLVSYSWASSEEGGSWR